MQLSCFGRKTLVEAQGIFRNMFLQSFCFAGTEPNAEVQSFSCLLLLVLVSKHVGKNVSLPVRIPFWNNQDKFLGKKEAVKKSYVIRN